MSKKNIARTKTPLAPKLAAKQTDYPVGQEDLNEQQQRVKNAVAVGAGALKVSAPAATAEPSPVAAAAPAKPLGPLAASWPSSTPPRAEAKPPQAPAAPLKAPVTATVPTRVPAPAPPPQAPPRPAPATSPQKSSAVAPAQKPTAAKTVNITFALSKTSAKRVALCGEFNGWSPNATPMKRHEDGHWETTVALSPGQYQYKFVVDGEWVPDPAAQNNLRNQYGSLNSVLDVRA